MTFSCGLWLVLKGQDVLAFPMSYLIGLSVLASSSVGEASIYVLTIKLFPSHFSELDTIPGTERMSYVWLFSAILAATTTTIGLLVVARAIRPQLSWW